MYISYLDVFKKAPTSTVWKMVVVVVIIVVSINDKNERQTKTTIDRPRRYSVVQNSRKPSSILLRQMVLHNNIMVQETNQIALPLAGSTPEKYSR
jgi:hypothetical protein